MNRKFFVALGILCVVGVAIGLSYTISQSKNIQDTPPPFPVWLFQNSNAKVTPTRPARCAPLPTIEISSISPTATPTRAPIAGSAVILAQPILPSPVAVQPFDLSPDVLAADKSTVEIFRCDGTTDVYLLGPDVDPNQAIVLGEGDIILYSIPPASLGGHQPPPPAIAATSQPSPAVKPYPASKK